MTAPPEAPATAADKTPPKVDASAVTVQRLGRRAVVRVVATSSERGTVGASGFVDIAGLSLPLASTSKRITVAGGGAELAIKLTAAELREARGRCAVPARGRAAVGGGHRRGRELGRQARAANPAARLTAEVRPVTGCGARPRSCAPPCPCGRP